METVAIDIDGTLADIVSAWLVLAEERHGIKAFKKDLVRYDFWNLLSITKSETYKLIAEAWEHPDRIMMEDRDIPAVMDNIGNAFNIMILTATLGEDKNIKSWLKMNGIRFDEFTHVEHSGMKHTLDDVAVYVDDSPSVIKEIAEIGKRAIMLRQPWNADFDAAQYNGKVLIAENWRQIERMLLDKEYLQPQRKARI